MSEQSNAAAERSAHVERGAERRPPGESFLVEVKPGVFKLKAVAEAERERDMWREENVKKQLACEQMGARIVALEAEAERLREYIRNIMKVPRSDAAYGIIQCLVRAALGENNHD